MNQFKFIFTYLVIRVYFWFYTGSKMLSINNDYKLRTLWFYGPITGDDRPTMWVSFSEIFSRPTITLNFESRSPGGNMIPVAFSTKLLSRFITYYRIFSRR